MALLIEGVGFYFASAPLMQRMHVAAEIAPEQIPLQIRKFADLILAGLLI